MSFASETKKELSMIEPEKKCCQLAEISGFLRVSGGIRLAGGGKFAIVVTTENPAVARHYKKLIKEYYNVDTELEIGKNLSLKKGHTYMLYIDPDMRSESILRESGILLVKEGNNYISDGIYDDIVKTKCCRKAYLRGVFLGAGTVNDPMNSYHLEFVLDSEVMARDLRRLIGSFVDLTAKVVERKGKYIVYMKKSQYISDMLAIMGAHSRVLEMENTKIAKELRGRASRLTNCDNANADRTVDAAEKQIAAIRKINNTLGLSQLPEKLREAAVVRISNPDASLVQLGEMMDPPLKKSGVNGRLKKIMDIADKL